MRDFYIVGSNMSFPTSPPGAMNGTMYELCAQYPGTPPDGSLARITCQPQPMITQYVYVQADLSPGSGIFDFCEVSVYGNKHSKYIVDRDDHGENIIITISINTKQASNKMLIVSWSHVWHFEFDICT